MRANTYDVCERARGGMMRTWYLGLLISCVAIAITVSPVASAGSCDVIPADAAHSTEEAEVLRLINEYRQEHGAGEMQLSADLIRSAALKSRDMAVNRYFSHTFSDGRTPGTVMTDCGFDNPYTWRGENLAGGQWTPSQAVEAWKNSTGHNALMLDPKYKAAGVGFVRLEGSPYVSYWTLNVASDFDSGGVFTTTPGPTPTPTLTRTPTSTRTPTPSRTSTPAPTQTPAGPTSTPTRSPMPTSTPVPPSAQPTNPMPTAITAPTFTPTATFTPTSIPTGPATGGLLATYYQDWALTTAVFTRVEPRINFNWTWRSPGPGVPSERFGARFDGWLLITEAGQYEFESLSDDGNMLWIGGATVVSDWSNHGAQPGRVQARGTIHLQRGWHRINVAYYEASGNASYLLRYALRGQSLHEIPSDRLAHEHPY